MKKMLIIGLLAVLLSGEGEIFDIRARNLPLGALLNSIAQQLNLILVTEKEVDLSIPVSHDIIGATEEEVLTAILTPLDYYSEKEGRFLKIKALKTEIYRLAFVPSTFTVDSSLGGDVLGGIAGGIGGGGGGGVGAPGGVGGAGRGNIRGSFTVQARSEENEFWKQLRTSIEKNLSAEGSSQIDPASGVVVVRDRLSRLAVIRKIIAEYQRMLTHMIVLKVRVVEVTLDEASQAGIDFTRLFGPTLGQTQVTVEQNLAPGITQGISVKGATPHSPEVLIQALQEFGTVSVKQNPHILVLDGQTAIISVGEIFPFISQVSTTLVPQVGAQTSIQLSQAQFGVLLGVTPKISDEGEILMHVVPLITSLKELITFRVGEGAQALTIQAPDLLSRGTSTLVKVKNGETLILGGLMEERENRRTRKTPLLGDFPLLGSLFRQKITSRFKSELVIFVTPVIQTV
ncbi:MAG: type II secretion system protein GspD [bacterium JZ-2024 1]